MILNRSIYLGAHRGHLEPNLFQHDSNKGSAFQNHDCIPRDLWTTRNVCSTTCQGSRVGKVGDFIVVTCEVKGMASRENIDVTQTLRRT